VTGGEPDDVAAGNGSRGRAGLRLCSGPSHVPGHPVRAVPLAAFIPSRVPGRLAGGHGAGPRQRGWSGGVNQMGALPPGAGAD